MDQIKYSDILFILNPHSGKKNLNKVRRHILSADPALNLLVSDSKDELKRKLEQHFDDYKVFVVVGGDGTVNEVAKYLVNQPEKYLSSGQSYRLQEQCHASCLSAGLDRILAAISNSTGSTKGSNPHHSRFSRTA